MQELYTGSNDRQILVWSPSTPAFTEMVHHLSLGALQALFVGFAWNPLLSHGFEKNIWLELLDLPGILSSLMVLKRIWLELSETNSFANTTKTCTGR